MRLKVPGQKRGPSPQSELQRRQGVSKSSRFGIYALRRGELIGKKRLNWMRLKPSMGRWNSQKNQSDGSGYGDQDQLDGTSPKPAGSTQELKKSQDLNGTDQWGAEFEGDYFPEDEGWDY